MNQTDEEMMIKFLKRHYAITRIKAIGRFKRGMLLDDGRTYFVSDKNTHSYIKNFLITTLTSVFHYDETTCKTVLNKFLHF